METDEHILEAIGKTRVVVRDGTVVETGTPRIVRCPLARRFAVPVQEMTSEAIRANVEQRIRGLGMCRNEREIFSDDEFVPFGASELIACGIRTGILDAAVLVCEGAGTVIVRDPRMVQGIGGRMSGLVRTSPLPGVVAAIRQGGGTVLSPRAEIDQYKGTRLAFQTGSRKVAVTVADAETAFSIRRDLPEALIIGVHLTGVSRNDARVLVGSCDLISACASRWIREIAAPSALLQAGNTVPVFALTLGGKELILTKLSETTHPIFVKITTLPVQGKEQPEPLV